MGFLVLGISSGLSAGAGTLLFVALAGIGTIVILSLILRAQWRRVATVAAKSDVFETYASARGPQPPEGDLTLAGVGLARGPVGRFRVDRQGVAWASRWRKSAPGLQADWEVVADVTLTPIRGLGHPTYVEIRLQSGERWSLSLSNRDALEATLAKVRGGA